MNNSDNKQENLNYSPVKYNDLNSLNDTNNLDFTTKGFQNNSSEKKKTHNFDFTTQGIQKDKLIN